MKAPSMTQSYSKFLSKALETNKMKKNKKLLFVFFILMCFTGLVQHTGSPIIFKSCCDDT